jgi:uncharacterized protein
MQTSQAAPPQVRFIDCRALAAEPWINGGGVTRTIARGAAPDGGTLWRVSLATLDGSAEFSRFDGFERIFTLLGDSRLVLHSTPEALLAEPGQPLRFPGERPIRIDAPAQPRHALNVMTRRDACHAEIELPATGALLTPCPIQLLICLSGMANVHSARLGSVPLAPLQALFCEARDEALQLDMPAPATRLAAIRIMAL